MKTTRLLVLRFSAMGDVALVVPVVRSLVTAHPSVNITVVTRPRFAPMFSGLEGVEVFPADVDGEYRGLPGLWKLYRRLRAIKTDRVIDLHDHLRTQVLGLLMKASGIPVIVFEKGRKEKKKATGANRSSHRTQLPHTTVRYQEALRAAGFSFNLLPGPHLSPGETTGISETLGLEKHTIENSICIGIAPFSAHASKTWPLENFSAVMEHFRNRPEIRFFLFGGGRKEVQALAALEAPGRITSVAGKLTLKEEMQLMAGLQAMVCVDSSNMHLAGLAGVPVISIWGGTDPITGFGPANNGKNKMIAVPFTELECRPCSVYGTETCQRGDFACLNRVTPQQVATSLSETISSV